MAMGNIWEKLKNHFNKNKKQAGHSEGALYRPDGIDIEDGVVQDVESYGREDEKLENNIPASEERSLRNRKIGAAVFILFVLFVLFSGEDNSNDPTRQVAVDAKDAKVDVGAPNPNHEKRVALPPSLNVRGIIDATAKQEISRRDEEARKKMEQLQRAQAEELQKFKDELMASLADKNNVSAAQPEGRGGGTTSPVYYPPSPTAVGNGYGGGTSTPAGMPAPNMFGHSYEIVDAVPFQFEEDESVEAVASSGVVASSSEPSFVDEYNSFGSGGGEDDYITSGSFVRGTIIQGADVPAPLGGGGEKFPILIHLTEDSFGPNFVRRPIKECFVIASGYGDISSEKAFFRTESISCEFDDGTEMDTTSIKGYVADIDGKAGVRGPVVWRNGAMIAASMASGFLSGFGEAASAASIATNSAVTASGIITQETPSFSSIMQSASFQGAATAAEKIGAKFDEYADAIFPLIQIGALREVDIVLLKGLWLEANVHKKDRKKGGDQ